MTKITLSVALTSLALAGCSQDFCLDVLKGCPGTGGSGIGGGQATTVSSGATSDGSSTSVSG